MNGLVECIPNFSEGRRADVIDALRAAVTSVPGAHLLDVQSDADHNRSGFTFVGSPEAASEAAFRAAKVARERIDLRTHRGAHPRMGATDVIPFVPLAGTTMDDCVALAKKLGERIGKELEIPVFLYARAASRPTRERLPDVRKGEFEGLVSLIGTDPERDPDFGPKKIHASAGATAVGARPFLIAYNIYLKGCDETLAKAIAKKIRTSSGGMPALQAMGLTVNGEPQVSMNLLDIDATPLHAAYDAVAAAAREAGADVAWSEIVGLLPERAVDATAADHIKLRDPIRDHVLEDHVRRKSGPSLEEFMESVASSNPTPGGGTVSAVAGAMAAALAAMVGRLTVGRKKYAAVDEEFRGIISEGEALRGRLVRLGAEDAAAYTAVSAAYGIPKDRAEERTHAIQAALIGAAKVPLETLRACREVAALAVRCAEAGNKNAVSDAGVATMLAGAAAAGAAYNVRINVVGMPDPSAAAALVAEATELLAEARSDCAKARELVEAAIG